MFRKRHTNSSRDDEGSRSMLAAKVAPAVALLLMGEAAVAGDDDDGPVDQVPEPGVLGLLAAGVAAVSTVNYIHKKRRK